MSHILPSLPVQQDYVSASELHPRPPHLAPDMPGQLRTTLETIRNSRDIQQVAAKVKQYCVMLVSGREQELFIEHFLQTKFLQLLHRRLVQFRYGGVLLRSVFAVFQFLMKGLKMEENLMFFLLQLNQVGFVSERYVFREEEDIAYYGNFLKLLVRKVNDDEKYLTVFFNMNKPHFPLLLNLLRFHDASDMVLHTTVKLVLLELAKNPNPALTNYTHNFPFVLFYPLYVAQIAISFRKAIAEEPGWDEHLSQHLKYMEDFIADKDRAAVDIYTNTFLQAIGKEIRQQLMNTTEKTIRRAVIMLRLMVEVVIPELSVLKIKMGLLLLLLPETTASMNRAVESKLPELDTRYWLVQECEEEVISHCMKLFYGKEVGGKSLMKTVNSFIPGSKPYWLYYEMRKLGELIGFSVTMRESLDLEKYLPESFLHALESLPDETLKPNDLFLHIVKLKDEELLYYYIRLLTPLLASHPISFNFLPLLNQLHNCNSLSLLHVFYTMILNSRIQVIDTTILNPLYEQLTQRLVHFVMTKGWKEFLIRVEGSRLKQNNTTFFLDAYREVQCDIILFAAIRCLLGTWNDEADPFNIQDWNQQNYVTGETTFLCHSANENLTLTLDGQYVKIRNCMEMLIHTEQLLLNQLRLYEEGESIQLMGLNDRNWGITLQIDNKTTDFLLREANGRKKLSARVSRELRTMRLPFVL